MLCIAIQFSTIQYNSLQYSSVQYSTVQNSTSIPTPESVVPPLPPTVCACMAGWTMQVQGRTPKQSESLVSGTWSMLAPLLPTPLHLVALELPGHGASSHLPSGRLLHGPSSLPQVSTTMIWTTWWQSSKSS